MTADPAGSCAASFAIDAVTSADMAPSIASRSAASAPKPGTTVWGASMKPAQKRTGSASALSHDSHDVTPGGLAAAQLDSSTLLPAPADPTTTVRRLRAPAASWSCSADLVTSVVGSVVGRNFDSANRAPCDAPCSVVPWVTTSLPQVLFHSGSPGPLVYLIGTVPLHDCRARPFAGHADEGKRLMNTGGCRVTLGGVMTRAPIARHAGGTLNRQTVRRDPGATTDV